MVDKAVDVVLTGTSEVAARVVLVLDSTEVVNLLETVRVVDLTGAEEVAIEVVLKQALVDSTGVVDILAVGSACAEDVASHVVLN